MAFFTLKRVQDADYLLRRAQEEAALAAAASDPRVAEAHDALASRYLDQIFGTDARPEGKGLHAHSSPADADALKLVFERLGQSILADQEERANALPLDG